MSDPSSTPPDPLARLIHAAGRREAPPVQAYERALGTATEAWQEKVRRRRWRAVAGLGAGFATIVVAAGALLRSIDLEQPVAEPIANVVRVIGAVRVRVGDESAWTSLREDAGLLPSGSALRTQAASAAALRIDDISVRIADDAEVVIESRSRLRLVRGKVYVDTGADSTGNRVLVMTDAGSVTDVGTQFEVQYREEKYRVRVREGEVLLQCGAQRRRGQAGEEIGIDRSGAVSIANVAPNDPDWRWVHVLATAPDIDDKPLTVLLAWVARETGAPVQYATPTVERKATTTILHGSIRHLAPLEALAVMLATTDLQHEVLADGTIMIK